MWKSVAPSYSQYLPVYHDEDGEKNELATTVSIRRDRTATLLKQAYLTLLHIALLLALGVLSLRYFDGASKYNRHVFPSELACAADYIQYVETTFAPGGFTDHPELQSEYYGPPTAEKDKLWEDLYAVGIAVITADEHAQFVDKSTTPEVDSNANLSASEYVVTLEAFHQLHCLDYLRHASYATATGHGHHEDETEWSKTRHIDHCLDYLRQVIQCHGDMTPIMMESIPGVPALPFPNPPPYKPNFEIRHTCRNWDMVYDFALARNSSGYKVA